LKTSDWKLLYSFRLCSFHDIPYIFTFYLLVFGHLNINLSRKQRIICFIQILDLEWYMNNISNFSTSLVLFLQRYVFVPFNPVAFIKWGLTLWPKLIPYAIMPSFLGNCVIYLYWLLDWKLTSLSHVTFAGYVRRDSCWFTVCYILFEQIETEVRLEVSFWPASCGFIY
jgi:hypothetical protein